jgi:hypothetical protein
VSGHQFSDKDLRCTTCGDGFVFSAGEQELFRLRGVPSQPEQCPSCARKRLVHASRVGHPEAR